MLAMQRHVAARFSLSLWYFANRPIAVEQLSGGNSCSQVTDYVQLVPSFSQINPPRRAPLTTRNRALYSAYVTQSAKIGRQCCQ